jgi:hypothetical protein
MIPLGQQGLNKREQNTAETENTGNFEVEKMKEECMGCYVDNCKNCWVKKDEQIEGSQADQDYSDCDF